MQEWNDKHREFNGSSEELPQVGEVRSSDFQTPTAEFQDSPEAVPKLPKKKKRSGPSKQSLTSLFSSVAAVAVLAVAVVLPTTGKSARSEIVEALTTDTAVRYQVLVEKTDSPLKIVVYNDFTRREADLAEGENSGELAGLKPGMQYTVAVTGNFGFGEKNVSEQKVRTLRPEELPVTELRSVEHECRCNVDGFFHFSMDLVDENGYWTDFEATLTDAYGNAAFIKVPDSHAAQRLDVIENGLRGSTATLTITAMTSEPGASGTRKTLYLKQVKI